MEDSIKGGTTAGGLKIVYVPITSLLHPEYNPRLWTEEATESLRESVSKHGVVDPLIVNTAPGREGVVIGGNFRLEILRDMGYEEVPVVEVRIEDIEREKDLCLRLNKAVGAWDFNLLNSFDESFLTDIGFTSEELDKVFPVLEQPEEFDLKKELDKLKIGQIEIQKGDVWQLGPHRLMCGDSTIEEDVLKLMNGEKADMVLTDPPYILDYLRGKKKNGEATEGFGLKRNRRYLETDVLPPNFSEMWMANVAKVANADFSIICFENWKNIPIIWSEMMRHWKVRNMIVWHLPNRVQGFAAKSQLFNKYDIAMVGTSEEHGGLNEEAEDALFQNEYETALYAVAGKPHWESYEKGKKFCPTDFVEHVAEDEKSSGQGIVFGTKPIEILIPYLKVLTKRGALVLEPFGGSGPTLIAAEKLGRRCNIMEKSAVYAEVIRNRYEKLTGIKAEKIT